MFELHLSHLGSVGQDRYVLWVLCRNFRGCRFMKHWVMARSVVLALMNIEVSLVMINQISGCPGLGDCSCCLRMLLSNK